MLMLALFMLCLSCSNNKIEQDNNSIKKDVRPRTRTNVSVPTIVIDESLDDEWLMSESEIYELLQDVLQYDDTISLSFLGSEYFWPYFVNIIDIFDDVTSYPQELTIPSITFCVANCNGKNALLLPYKSNTSSPIIFSNDHGWFDADYFNLANALSYDDTTLYYLDEVVSGAYINNSSSWQDYDIMEQRYLWSLMVWDINRDFYWENFIPGEYPCPYNTALISLPYTSMLDLNFESYCNEANGMSSFAVAFLKMCLYEQYRSTRCINNDCCDFLEEISALMYDNSGVLLVDEVDGLNYLSSKGFDIIPISSLDSATSYINDVNYPRPCLAYFEGKWMLIYQYFLNHSCITYKNFSIDMCDPIELKSTSISEDLYYHPYHIYTYSSCSLYN